MPNYSRRELLFAAAATGAGLAAFSPATGLLAAENAKLSRKRAIRLAHLTDIHVQPELRGDRGMAACLKHVQSQADKPELILTGGDSIMDSFGQDAARTRLLWDVWKKVLRDDCSLPIETCIGNHDVWGWNQPASGAKGTEPLYGKKWATEALGLANRYRSFDRAGWHFIVLDSTHPGPTPDTYEARLDAEQFDWLVRDLASVDAKTPVLVLSHIPIISAAAFFDGDNEQNHVWTVPGAWMHLDARKIKDLFLKHPNVKVCLSGHLHLVDRVTYNGVDYLCNGAVCGGWWKGNYQECGEGYAVLDLFDDGSFDCHYVGYGWKAQA